MTAITPTEITVEDIPGNVTSGTGKRRARIYMSGTVIANGGSFALATYVPGLADIEGVEYVTDDGAAASSTPTWSTTTITVFDTSTLCEVCVIGTFN